MEARKQGKNSRGNGVAPKVYESRREISDLELERDNENVVLPRALKKHELRYSTAQAQTRGAADFERRGAWSLRLARLTERRVQKVTGREYACDQRRRSGLEARVEL
ncbi:MAG: hypothetical protein M1819_006110 [Sarea resinae]|nr:MAG: hypothetical protein M1819_006110 [Sarea resinae]